MSILRQEQGIDFRQYRRSGILRGIQSRMAVTNVDTIVEYAWRLRNDPVERGRLLERILIKTTSFFRDPDCFHTLEERALVPLVQDRPASAHLRLWSVGCSSGEEPYTLAMLLTEVAERLGTSAPFRIIATDISPAALARARAGVFSERAMAGVSPERRGRFFTVVPGGFRILPSIRRACIFTEHNLVGSIPFSKMDLVTCRNLLIYMDADLQRVAQERLHYALRPGGFLMLGSGEVLQRWTGWRVVHRRHRLFQRLS